MIGADLIGIGTAFTLITSIKFIIWIVPVATAIWLLVLFTRFETFTRYLGAVVIIFLAYIVSAIFAHPSWGQVVKDIALPPIQLKFTYLSAAVGILGATFTPPLFFWQAKQEVEEDGNTIERARKQNRLMAPGFIFGQLVTLFIMIATAATLYQHHQQIKTAADAARALEPFAGPAAKYLFAIGLIGSGLMAIPVLASSAGYMVAETFGWKQSLSDDVDSAKGFYIVITLALFLGVEIAISGLDPIQVMFFSQVLAGFIGPFILVMVLIVANKRRIMGDHTNKAFDNIFSILAVVILAVSAILMIVQSLAVK
jgi:Mn2+/Fe2+ NRAMP family transporter